MHAYRRKPSCLALCGATDLLQIIGSPGTVLDAVPGSRSWCKTVYLALLAGQSSEHALENGQSGRNSCNLRPSTAGQLAVQWKDWKLWKLLC